MSFENSGRYPYGSSNNNVKRSPEFYKRVEAARKEVCDAFLDKNLGKAPVFMDKFRKYSDGPRTIDHHSIPEYVELFHDVDAEYAFNFFLNKYDNWSQFATLALNFDIFVVRDRMAMFGKTFRIFPNLNRAITVGRKPDKDLVEFVCWLCDMPDHVTTGAICKFA